ncbi:ethanolaminephosphotransferase 1 [Mytilinidion resinicola]|uniref:Ethanolaminephosphotransferase 1 n=1 Tax=Mytilinidion resinicola TaxID=574789 RepID=A0A6A6YIH0_9PEZI|nr:ethanolaminephosphotransferase 1 [Mytilinidion resinicola]KAF2808590.1 ethanolaminephosphotransferase 1 [Mytilinidion resinicola]
MKPSSKKAAHECVSDEALAHLKTYKYSSVDKSLISRYILKHYWNGFVELLPLWLAPNMVTLLGFFFILGNVALLSIYVPDLVGPGPSWLYYSFAVGLWMYSTMDNVDGKQARRTGTSSGLGELFDHGIDSLNCTLASLLETAAMGYGPTKTGAFTALIPCLPMFFSTWETYHTHTLYLGYFNGPTEGLILACTIMILSGYYGPEMWSTPLVAHFPSLEPHIGQTTFRDLWVPILISSFLIAHLPACIVNVSKARRAQGLSILPLFVEWTPMAIFVASTAAWLGSPHSNLLTDNHLVLFCLTMSLVFGRMTTKIILAHLTHQPFPMYTVMLTPLVIAGVAVNFPYFPIIGDLFSPISAQTEHVYLWCYFIFAAIVYANWAILVIGRICEYLGINCLTIPSKSSVSEKSSISNGATNGSLGKGRKD